MAAQIKIGFDAKRIFQNYTGLGNYGRTLLTDLSENTSHLDCHLFAPKKIVNERTAPFLLPPFQNHFANTIFRTSWRSRGIVQDLLKADINIYHGLSHEIPFGIEQTKIRTVVSMHDLIIKADPKQFKFLDRFIYNKKFQSSCERADKLVAISQSTKNDLLKYYNVAAEKIEVIYQTCHAQFKRQIDPLKLNQFQINQKLPGEYLLYVGAAIPRKNLLGLVKALFRLPKDLKIPLVVVAGNSAYLKKVQRFVAEKEMQDKVTFKDKFPFHQLPYLYSGASVLCYPSQYEGFGLPIIESLFCKTPVLTGNNSSLPEAAGPGGLLVDVKDKDALTDGLRRLLEDVDLRKTLADKGFQHVQKFHSGPIIKQWTNLYQEMV